MSLTAATHCSSVAGSHEPRKEIELSDRIEFEKGKRLMLDVAVSARPGWAWIRILGWSLSGWLVLVSALRGETLSAPLPSTAEAQRWNILWISCEDISPDLGSYGYEHAWTPNLDQLSREGCRFDRAFVPAGVCAVVRSGVITGMYPVALGSQHMRSRIVPPPEVKCFTEFLRAAGYFCTNRSKTDYQFESPLTAWDRQGNQHQDWRDRAEGQPFFSVINLTMTHESQVRHAGPFHERQMQSLPSEARHDPDHLASSLPPYFPDTPAVRRDWAWYHDNISAMDHEVGAILAKLEADGLSDSTIVIFWSDHGQGLPRGKRWLYDSGTRVPLIVRWPGQVAPGEVREDLVSLLDLPATVLEIAGVARPDYFAGRVILGAATEPEPAYLFQHRDRMDEALDMSRAIRSRRFRYQRNYEPHRSYAQGLGYLDLMPTMIEWRREAAAGRLTDIQAAWFQTPKPVEEFYDLELDPHEVQNLIDDPLYQDQVMTMRQALEQWQDETGDLGMLPEPVQMSDQETRHPQRVTLDPTWEIRMETGMPQLHLDCQTPGASLGYRFNSDPQGAWRLYTGPVAVERGDRLRVVAERLGYKTSERIEIVVP